MSYILWIDHPESRALDSMPGLPAANALRVSSRDALEDALRDGGFELCFMVEPPPGIGEAELLELIEAARPGLTIFRSSSARLELERGRELKQDAMRALAAGVAHDLNNMLGVIASYASVFRDELAPSDPRRNDTLEILGACARARATTEQLLAFSRRRPVLPEHLDLSVHLERRRELLERQVGDPIEWNVELEPASFVFVDPSQLDEAVLQLVLNANDAMPRGGRLHLRAHTLVVEEARICSSGPLAAGSYVCLSLADEGVGMTPEVQSRIFEPFYAHGRAGKGRGLGLNIVQGFAEGAGGAVQVESAPERGTKVSLFLPVSSARAVTPEE